MSRQDALEATKTPQQKLAHISEECAEVIKNIAKSQRFGMWPTMAGKAYDNFSAIENEIDDLFLALRRWREYVAASTPDQRRKVFNWTYMDPEQSKYSLPLRRRRVKRVGSG